MTLPPTTESNYFDSLDSLVGSFLYTCGRLREPGRVAFLSAKMKKLVEDGTALADLQKYYEDYASVTKEHVRSNGLKPTPEQNEKKAAEELRAKQKAENEEKERLEKEEEAKQRAASAKQQAPTNETEEQKQKRLKEWAEAQKLAAKKKAAEAADEAAKQKKKEPLKPYKRIDRPSPELLAVGYAAPKESLADAFFGGPEVPLEDDETASLIFQTKRELDLLHRDFIRHHADSSPLLSADQDIIREGAGKPLHTWAAVACSPFIPGRYHPVLFYQTMIEASFDVIGALMCGQYDVVLQAIARYWPWKDLPDPKADLPLVPSVMQKAWTNFATTPTTFEIWHLDKPKPDALRSMAAKVFMKEGEFRPQFNWIDAVGKLPDASKPHVIEAEKLSKRACFNAAFPGTIREFPQSFEIEGDNVDRLRSDADANALICAPRPFVDDSGAVQPFPSVYVQARTLDGRTAIKAKQKAASEGKPYLAVINDARIEAVEQIPIDVKKAIDYLKTEHQNLAVETSTKMMTTAKAAIEKGFSELKEAPQPTGVVAVQPGVAMVLPEDKIPFQVPDSFGTNIAEVKQVFAVADKKVGTTWAARLKQPSPRPAHPDADVLMLGKTPVDAGDFVSYVADSRTAQEEALKAKEDKEDEDRKKTEESFRKQLADEQTRLAESEKKRGEIMKLTEESRGVEHEKLWFDPSYGCAPRRKPTSGHPDDWEKNLDREQCMMWLNLTKSSGDNLDTLPGSVTVDSIMADLARTTPSVVVLEEAKSRLENKVSDEYVSNLRKLLGRSESDSLDGIDVARWSPAEIWRKLTASPPEIIVATPGDFVGVDGKPLPTPLDAATVDEKTKYGGGIPADDLATATAFFAEKTGDAEPIKAWKRMALEWWKRRQALEIIEKKKQEILDMWKKQVEKFLVIPTVTDFPETPAKYDKVKKGTDFYEYDGSAWQKSKYGDKVYKAKFVATALAHKALRSQQMYAADEQMAVLWHPQDIANASMELAFVSLLDDPTFTKPTATVATIAGKKYVHVQLPQFAADAAEAALEPDLIRDTKVDDLLDDLEEATAKVVEEAEMHGSQAQVNARALGILADLAAGVAVRPEDLATIVGGGLVDADVLATIIGNTPLCKNETLAADTFKKFVGRDPTEDEKKKLKNVAACASMPSITLGSGSGGGGGGGSGSGSGGGSGSGSGGGGFGVPIFVGGGYSPVYGAPSLPPYDPLRQMIYPSPLDSRLQDSVTRSYAQAASRLSSFGRDYPKLAAKLWESGKKEDARMAARVYVKTEPLVRLAVSSRPPLGQILDAKKTSVIGYVAPDGRVVETPLLPIMPQVPVVGAGSLIGGAKQYRRLNASAVDFARDYLEIEKRYMKRRKK
jgi:uncharacterized membrane protein YgcG